MRSTPRFFLRKFVIIFTVLLFLALTAWLPDAAIAKGQTVSQVGVGWYLPDGRSGVSTQRAAQTFANGDAVGFESQLFAQVNAARVARGLAPLKVNDKLKKNARDYAKAMSKSGRFHTVDASGKSPRARRIPAIRPRSSSSRASPPAINSRIKRTSRSQPTSLPPPIYSTPTPPISASAIGSRTPTTSTIIIGSWMWARAAA